jgi:hypothetical protein
VAGQDLNRRCDARVWARIEGNAGQEFRQKRGKSFTYAVNDGCVVPSTTNPILPRSDFAKAFERQPLGSPIRHRSSAAARGRPRSVRTCQAGLNTVTAPAVPTLAIPVLHVHCEGDERGRLLVHISANQSGCCGELITRLR